MLIVMAGLSGTGKSTIAVEIAKVLRAEILSKDVVRAASFPGIIRDYTAQQDDLVMEMVYSALTYAQQHAPAVHLVVDGRTFSKRAQVQRLLAVTDALRVQPRFLECVCDDATVQRRLLLAHATAANRDFKLYERLQREADPLEVERLTLNTGKLSLPEAVAQAFAYLSQ